MRKKVPNTQVHQTWFLTHINHVIILFQISYWTQVLGFPVCPVFIFWDYSEIHLYAIFYFLQGSHSSYNLYLDHVFHSFNFFLETSLLFIESNYFQIEKFIVDFRFWVIFKFRNIRRGKIGERRYLRLAVNWGRIT